MSKRLFGARESKGRIQDLRVQVFTPIDRESPIIEVVHGDDILCDVCIGDDGVLEFLANAPILGRPIDLWTLLEMLGAAAEELQPEAQDGTR